MAATSRGARCSHGGAPPLRADETLTWPTAQFRLTSAAQQAKWRNDPTVAAKIKDLAPRIKDLLAKSNPAEAERLLTEAETAAGLDPGGRSMSGIPICHPTPELADQLTHLRADLDAALRAKDKAAIARVIEQTRAALGPQAGLPDTASPGPRNDPRPIPCASTTNTHGSDTRPHWFVASTGIRSWVVGSRTGWRLPSSNLSW